LTSGFYFGKLSHLLEVTIHIGIDENTKEGEEMQNVEWEIKGDKLIVEIDLTTSIFMT